MTIDEQIDRQQRIEQKILHANNITMQAASAGMSECLRQFSSACESLNRAFDYSILTETLQNYANVFSQTQIQFENMMQKVFVPSLLSGIEDSFRSLTSATQTLSSSMLAAMNFDAQSYAFDAISRSLRITLDSVAPYVREDQIESLEQLEQTAEPILKPHGKQRASLSDLLSVISLLLTLYFGIISSIPDERIDRIIAQNETIINQNAEIHVLEKEDKVLRDVLYHLTDSINLLTDEVESLREKLESAESKPAPERQNDAEDSQQQNDDTQNQVPVL